MPASTSAGPTCGICSKPAKSWGCTSRTQHNVHFMLRLMDDIRASIADGTFLAFKDAFLAGYRISNQEARSQQREARRQQRDLHMNFERPSPHSLVARTRLAALIARRAVPGCLRHTDGNAHPGSAEPGRRPQRVTPGERSGSGLSYRAAAHLGRCRADGQCPCGNGGRTDRSCRPGAVDGSARFGRPDHTPHPSDRPGRASIGGAPREPIDWPGPLAGCRHFSW